MSDHQTRPHRPAVKRGLQRLWRDSRTLQLGVDPRHAVVLRDVTSAERALLSLLDGSRDVEEIARDAAEIGLSRDDVDQMLHTLADADALDDGSVDLPAMSETQRQQLEPEVLTLQLLHPAPAAAARMMTRRQSAHIVVRGGSRVGATIAALLAASGVGAVTCTDDAPLRQADLSPAGVREMRSGSRGDAVAAVVASMAGQWRRGEADETAVPRRGRSRKPPVVVAPTPPTSLAVIASVGGFPRVEHVVANRELPHLLVGVCETTATVGPLVLPGQTACLRCLQLHRGDRDGGWAMVAAQLAGRGHRVEPCDVSLATLAAALATTHVLSWIDQPTPSAASLNGVLEFGLRDGRLRRRTVVPHPGCGCGAAGTVHAVTALPDCMSPARSA
jgi:bacteriocin biosynthesis cyclodehydratase domain-containing protein